MRQSEFATDVLFRDAALRPVYAGLIDHAIRQFGSDDVLRFLGRRTNARVSGEVKGRRTSSRFAGEVKSELRRREEGVCIKHWVEQNSIKMYDKQGSVLRVETTLNNPRPFKVRRTRTRNGRREQARLPMRQGVADLKRRVEVCRAANERYLEALAIVGRPAPLPALLDPLTQRIVRDGRPYRGLRPIAPEEDRLFAEVLRGEFRLQGFRNRDLLRHLYPKTPTNPHTRRRNAARITRLLRLLRAHGLIRKVPPTHYYRVTPQGEKAMTVAHHVRQLDLSKLAA